ncbi:unnamed protein product [Caenorhabditis sp. 36 PRJEB53466]|nr:unnamed protein product [Caenorhabditis sp. 36 PRJEB53466]
MDNIKTTFYTVTYEEIRPGTRKRGHSEPPEPEPEPKKFNEPERIDVDAEILRKQENLEIVVARIKSRAAKLMCNG